VAAANRRGGYAGANPVSALGRRDRPSVKGEKPKRILNDVELASLIEHASDLDRMLIEFTARTGLRKGEALGLRWVDVKPGVVSITRQLDRHGKRVPLKTERSEREVDITPQLAARLREHRMASPKSGDHDLVFVRLTGEPYSHSAADRAIRAAARRAGLQGEKRDDEWIVAPLSFHSLRHSHISALIAAGWDIQEIADRAGDTVGTITTEYAHAYDAARRAQSRRDRLAAMEAAMEAGGSNSPQQTATAMPSDLAAQRAKRGAAQ
jgi:integrase